MHGGCWTCYHEGEDGRENSNGVVTLGYYRSRRHGPVHPLAVAAFILSLVGIPLVGLVTGAIAVLLAGTALSQIASHPVYHGRRLALASMVIGMFDIIGWVLVLSLVLARPHLSISSQVTSPTFPSPAFLAGSPGHIRQALQANVYFRVEVESRLPFFDNETFIGSGVVVGESEGHRAVLTNRHLVEPSFDSESPWLAGQPAHITVYLHDGTVSAAYVTWTAPHGIDLAVVTTGSRTEKVGVTLRPAPGDPSIGARVFAVGNPHELSWSYTEGVISGIRTRERGPFNIRLLQTQTPINPGSSGGGLYAADGTLLGIVTWTKQKTQAEGISFAISYQDFLQLYDARTER